MIHAEQVVPHNIQNDTEKLLQNQHTVNTIIVYLHVQAIVDNKVFTKLQYVMYF